MWHQFKDFKGYYYISIFYVRSLILSRYLVKDVSKISGESNDQLYFTGTYIYKIDPVYTKNGS